MGIFDIFKSKPKRVIELSQPIYVGLKSKATGVPDCYRKVEFKEEPIYGNYEFYSDSHQYITVSNGNLKLNNGIAAINGRYCYIQYHYVELSNDKTELLDINNDIKYELRYHDNNEIYIINDDYKIIKINLNSGIRFNVDDNSGGWLIINYNKTNWTIHNIFDSYEEAEIYLSDFNLSKDQDKIRRIEVL